MNKLLKDDLFLQFPILVQRENAPEWRTFADELNLLRDELVSNPQPDEGGIETLGLIYDPDRTPVVTFDHMAHFFDVTFLPADTDTIRRRKLLRAVRKHRIYATIQDVIDTIFELLGITVTITSSTVTFIFNEANASVAPDQVGVFSESLSTSTYNWKEQNNQQVVVDLNGALLTGDQLLILYTFLAMIKAAQAIVLVTNSGSVLKVIYSTDLSLVEQPYHVDPES
jgi:hypothetical protein